MAINGVKFGDDVQIVQVNFVNSPGGIFLDGIGELWYDDRQKRVEKITGFSPAAGTGSTVPRTRMEENT